MKKFLKLYGIIIHAVMFRKKEEAVSNQNITYATLRVVHP